MALKEALQCITLPAAGDLSAKQYRFVEINSSGQVAAVASAGARGVGILQNKPSAAGQAATVAIGGVSKVMAGGTYDAGDLIQSDANGDAIEAASGDFVLAQAIVGAVDNDIASVLLVSKHLNV